MLLEIAIAATCSRDVRDREHWVGSDAPRVHDVETRAVVRANTLRESDEVYESQARSEETLSLMILKLLTAQPHLDDVELASQLNEVPVVVSRLLRKMAAEGLVKAA